MTEPVDLVAAPVDPAAATVELPPAAMAQELTTRALFDRGYTEEANRQFFHGLGLALVVFGFDATETRLGVITVSEKTGGVAVDRQMTAMRDRAEMVLWEQYAALPMRLAAFGREYQPI